MRPGIALAMALVICGVAAGRPALADHDDHHGGGWEHERHDRGWHGHRGHFFYPSDREVFYAPPPVVYAPAYPSPGLSFVFPLWIH
jgi:hypothetical protein